MALSARDQLKYWGIGALVLLLALWLLGNVLLPFAVGLALAYFLDPLADRLEKWGLSRGLATAVIIVVAVVILLIAGGLLLPALIAQAAELVTTAPELIARLQSGLEARFPHALDQGGPLRNALESVGEAMKEQGPELFKTVIGSVGSVVGIGVLLVVAPVVAVFMLLDWDRMVARIDELLPREHAPVLRRLAHEIDQTLSGFLRGMGLVCLILGTYYAIALTAVGLSFGLVVGFIAGILTFIPYLGTILGGILAIGLALFQFWGDWGWVAAVTVIFVIGQAVEGNFLTPKLVGSSVGLHPVWLLLSISVFGALFGFAGMVVAVPLMAALGVIVRFLVQKYLTSSLYLGATDPELGTEDTAQSPPVLPEQDAP